MAFAPPIEADHFKAIINDLKPNKQLVSQWLLEPEGITTDLEGLSFHPYEWAVVNFPQYDTQKQDPSTYFYKQCQRTIVLLTRGKEVTNANSKKIIDVIEDMTDLYQQLSSDFEEIVKCGVESNPQLMRHYYKNKIQDFKDLSAMVSAVEVLKNLINSRKISSIHLSLQNLSDLSQRLSAYQQFDILHQLEDRVKVCKNVLSSVIFHMWSDYIDSPNPQIIDQLRNSCHLLELYYPSEIKLQLTKWWVHEQINYYQHLSKSFTLDNPINYQYLSMESKRMNKEALLPPTWHADLIYTLRWLDVTRSHLVNSLRISEQNAIDEHNAKVATEIAKEVEAMPSTEPLIKVKSPQARVFVEFDIYKSLLRTIEFEQYLKTKWSEPTVTHILSELIVQDLKPLKFDRLLVSAYDPYMKYYFQKEELQFANFIEQIENQDDWEVTSAESTSIFSEATVLFLMIQRNLLKSQKVISQPNDLKTLLNAYQKVVLDYIELLETNLPEGHDLSKVDITTIYTTINTTSYICDRFSNLNECQFAELVKGEPNAIEDRCSRLSYEAIDHLSDYMLSSVKPWLQKIRVVKGMGNADLQDELPYAKEIVSVLRGQLSDKAQMSHFNYLCQVLAKKFFEFYLTEIKALPFKVTEKMAQQLLLDLIRIRRFMTYEVIGLKDETTQKQIESNVLTGDLSIPNEFKAYLKAVQQLISPIENLLKTLTNPTEHLITTYRAIYPKASYQEVCDVLHLRGVTIFSRDKLIADYNASFKDMKDRIAVDKRDMGDKLVALGKDLRQLYN